MRFICATHTHTHTHNTHTHTHTRFTLEQGLVSAEFHYNYGTVGATGEHLLYLMFLGTGTNNDTHVVEYNVAASTTRMIFHLYQPSYIHNGGTIEFGKAPDNNL